MTSILILVLTALILWLRAAGAPEARPIDAQGRRIFVADGDTLRIGAETIRLAGIDAVERGQFCTDARGVAWSCGENAALALSAMVARGGLRCAATGGDRYGRTIARCGVSGRTDVGAQMVDDGWAVADRGGGYGAREQAARANRRGMWAGTFELPSIWREREGIQPKRVGAHPGRSVAP
jgi:endonuclease YncB( thermonuclease family)